jgi:HK97 family phage major capsid protein
MSSTISSPQVQLTPIAVGDLGRFVVRVAGPLRMIRLDERFAEYFQVGFEAFLRADGQLALTPGSDSPIKYMVTAG